MNPGPCETAAGEAAAPTVGTFATPASRHAELAETLKAWADAEKQGTLDLLMELLSIDGTSGDLSALDESAAFLRRELERLGAAVTAYETGSGTQLLGRFGPSGRGGPVVFLCHYDTVWPIGTTKSRPPRVDGELLYGPGVFDMRSGLICALRGIEALREAGALEREVALLLTSDEEIDSAGSAEIIRQVGREAHTVLIAEPSLPGGGMKVARKGSLTYRVGATGISAHAGLDPYAGASAVEALVEVVGEVTKLRDVPRETSVNVGVIHGGTLPNVVAEEAWAGIDVRMWDEDEYERLQQHFATLASPRGRVQMTVYTVDARPPMELSAAIRAASEEVRALAELLGMRLHEGRAGGVSDGNLIAPFGVRVVDGLGPEGGGAHAVDEHIRLQSLHERTALFGLLAAGLGR